MFSSLYDLFTETILGLITAFDWLYVNFFQLKLREILTQWISSDFILSIINNIQADILDYTLASLTLGVGLAVLIAITVVKWLLDIVT